MSLISDSDDYSEKAPPAGNSGDPSSKADTTSDAMEDSTLHETHAGDNSVSDSDKTTSFPAEISVAEEETVPKEPSKPTASPESSEPSEAPPARAPHQEEKTEVVAEPSTSAVGFDSDFDDVTLTMPREKTYAPKKFLCITVTSGSKFVCMVMATVVIFFFILLLALVLSVGSYREPETPSGVNATLNISSEYTTLTPEDASHLDLDYDS